MNLQQLQTARAALWHQTAPLQTADETTTWFEDLGLCLFLPRHAQLPAPAPSLVEAVHGAASAAPPAAALQRAGERAARLVDERRAIPLNLLGTYSEQADFLITPEVLPWVAAIRGDRQWNAAPGGRSAPLVVRTWEMLDREGEATATHLRELLGRELTEAAVLRALIELWTTVRAVPVYKQDEPARWTLLKNRFPAQMATGANTAQSTALSALLSIYLRCAVAATAEEAEIFLSPLTARSRIREVIHGMTAARQFGSMSVASQTLLFVEGSLPENLPAEEPAPSPATPAERPQRGARPPFRKDFQDKRRPLGGQGEARRGPRPAFQKRRPETGAGAKPWQRRPAFGKPERPAGEEGPRSESQSGARGEKRPSTGFRTGTRERPSTGFRPGARGEKRPSTGFRPAAGGERRPSTGFRPAAKPWERRPAFRRPEGTAGGERPGAASRPGARGEKRPSTGFRPGARGEKRPSTGFRPAGKPWERRAPSGEGRGDRPRFNREAGERPPRVEGGESGAGAKSGEKSRPSLAPKPGQRAGQKFGPRPGQRPGQKGGFRPGGPSRLGGKKPGEKRFGGPRPKFAAGREERGGAPRAQAPGGERRPGLGKPPSRKGAGPTLARGKNFKAPGKKNFRKADPGARNPGKNRSQEENPE
ncbi:MAG TPA: hypothetical protein VHX13_00420 [Acidobacteriaceae bacterium]|nr:hypothetical protein [Acidobacteriaceae bacterium]